MIIARDLRSWSCAADAPVLDALAQISANRHGAVFCVEPDGRLVGVLTDGDFRRWVVDQADLDLHRPVRDIANRSPRTAPASAGPAELEGLLDDRIAHIPLVDDQGHLVGVASSRTGRLELDGRTIGEDQPTFVIAEIGINHNGSLATALALIDHAADAGADSAKFQLRDLGSLYGASDRAGEDLGSQYTRELLDKFQLTNDEMFTAFDHCRSRGLVPLCTPWDHESVAVLEGYGIPGYKVASADLTNHDLVAAVAATGKPVLVSTGMSTEAEIREAVAVLQQHGAAYALLHCNSTYPAPYKDVNLRYLERLRQLGACPVGYSGHERGWHVPVASVALGARIIEKHLTVDRSMEGNDHKVSLLPDELARMVTEVRQLEESLGSPRSRSISQGEAMNRVTLAKSLVAVRDLAAGATVTRSDIAVQGPGRGLQPNRRNDLIGHVLTRSVAAGTCFYPSDLDADRVEPRPYAFRRPWGLPVRYHDFDAMLQRAAPDFVEFHLSYQDMDLDPETYVKGPQTCDFAVHSPDLFRGDHILNLASTDDEWWERSIFELDRCLELTRRMKPLFPSTERPTVIVSLGGFTADAPLAATERQARYDRVRAGLDRLDRTGVELVAQTLPPFPWYLGGQLHCNLFVDPEDTARFARDADIGLCLDVSHSKLACNHRGTSFATFVETLGPHVRHLHLVDATGSDGEGIQVGDGDIDWPVLAEQLDRLAPGVAFIPEIWQGHKNDGEGFWMALDRLEAWF
ncbi:N-acetylneuraminate synthase family protein [Aquihabitans sp. G128]|uniref:N-acetylneuraminate synthase family protein n=1 Tax=Aquihabitans sp. G128 TaxID=2849779 RepID=UPI001C21EE5D|nr:N-acetylneuraminate synthase family protein [Aquihabitans sp. G128]QXC60270.1 N-acetylneuraminate synthase family protein [Aquihabitans sp. G128]